MANKDSSEKTPTEEVDLTSISSILNVLAASFNVIQKPAKIIPPPLLLIGKRLRPGMSARNLAARTIARLESEGGLPMGDVFSELCVKYQKLCVINREKLYLFILPGE